MKYFSIIGGVSPGKEAVHWYRCLSPETSGRRSEAV